jgi:dTMP kinase
MAQAMLFNAARAEILAKVIRPALAEGKLVLCDRFLDSTLAYQGSEKGMDSNLLREIHYHAHDNILPDHTFLLDGNPKVLQARVLPAEKQGDKFDQLDLDRQSFIRGKYLESANWNWGSKQYSVINAEVSPDQVFAQVLPTLMLIQNKLKARPEPEGGYPEMIMKKMVKG